MNGFSKNIFLLFSSLFISICQYSAAMAQPLYDPLDSSMQSSSAYRQLLKSAEQAAMSGELVLSEGQKAKIEELAAALELKIFRMSKRNEAQEKLKFLIGDPPKNSE
jgi:hypothetical protein